MSEKQWPMIGVCVAKIQDFTTTELICSICDTAKQEHLHVQIFNMFSDVFNGDNHDIGERSVFDLIRYEQLAVLVVLSQTIKDAALVQQLISNAHEAGVPVISIDEKHAGCYNILYEYATPFEQLVRHVFEHHGCTRVDFLAGFQGNSFSDERIEVYKKVLAEHGIPFEPRRLKYGDFWEEPAGRATEEFLDDEIPDAIICANDTMAITVCSVLSAHGIRVPEDVIVTGFDGIEMERYHVPRLTTSAQDIAHAGRTAAQTAARLAYGEAMEPCDLPVHYELRYTQSCGCQPVRFRSAGEQVMKMYQSIFQFRNYESWMFGMVSRLTDNKPVMEMFAGLEKYLMGLSCHYIKVCVNGKYLRMTNAPISVPYADSDMFLAGERMPYAYSCPMTRFQPEIQVPDLAEMFEPYGQVIFLPLHNLNNVFGYIVIEFDTNGAQYDRYYSLTMSLSHSMNTVMNQASLLCMNRVLSETNQTLADMYIHDSMTGLMNRRGFFQELQKRQQKMGDEAGWVFIASIDMDGLKYINDTFGHQEGDFAIKTVGYTICSCAGDHGICARFGGDEYMVAILTADPEADGCNSFADRLTAALEACNRQYSKPYTLGASCGTELAPLTPDINIDVLMKCADDKMYTQKSKRKCLRASAR